MLSVTVAVLSAAVIGACSATVPATSLSDGAPPGVVLRTYLNALVTGDCATAKALSTPMFANDAWCFVPKVTAFSEPGLGYQRDDETGYSTQINIEWGFGSISDGEHTWFYQLRRDPGGPWRVAGGGTGP